MQYAAHFNALPPTWRDNRYAVRAVAILNYFHFRPHCILIRFSTELPLMRFFLSIFGVDFGFDQKLYYVQLAVCFVIENSCGYGQILSSLKL